MASPWLTDRRCLYGAGFLRALATSMSGVVLALYLAARGLDAGWIGAVVSAGLSGAALASLAVTLGTENGQRITDNESGRGSTLPRPPSVTGSWP